MKRILVIMAMVLMALSLTGTALAENGGKLPPVQTMESGGRLPTFR